MVREPDAAKNLTQSPSGSVRLLRNDILTLMDAEALLCAVLFFCTVLYFPSRPSLPPSLTSTVPRLNIKDGVRSILKYEQVFKF